MDKKDKLIMDLRRRLKNCSNIHKEGMRNREKLIKNKVDYRKKEIKGILIDLRRKVSHLLQDISGYEKLIEENLK